MTGERFTVGSVSGAQEKNPTWTVHDTAYCHHVVKTFGLNGARVADEFAAFALAAHLNARHEAWLTEVAA